MQDVRVFLRFFQKISVILIDISDNSGYNDKCEAHKQVVLRLFDVKRAENRKELVCASAFCSPSARRSGASMANVTSKIKNKS